MFSKIIDFAKENLSNLKENETSKAIDVPIQEDNERKLLKSIIDELDLDRFTIRSFREMFDASSFHYPIEKLSDRIYSNIRYYGANYTLILFLFFSYLCITNPLFLFGIACSIYAYHNKYNTKILGVCIVVSCLLGGTSLFITCLLGSSLLIFHSVMKSSPIKKSD